ncbi:MAG: hypothetical protein VX761_03580 [Planctomycetota bacterium]|nr:hypothetical protein [Planctomycetota bacterium]
MSMYVATKKLWQRAVYATVLLVLCMNAIEVDAADMGLGDAMSKAERRRVPIFVYVYDSI